MRAPFLIGCGAIAVLACGGGTSSSPSSSSSSSSSNALSNSVPAPPPDAAPLESEAMTMMRKFAVDMCACTTTQCAHDVSTAMTRWSQREAARQTEPFKLTEAEMTTATELGMKMGECMQRAMQPAQQTP